MLMIIDEIREYFENISTALMANNLNINTELNFVKNLKSRNYEHFSNDMNTRILF